MRMTKMAIAAALGLAACGSGGTAQNQMPDMAMKKEVIPPPLQVEVNKMKQAANTACLGTPNDPPAPTMPTVVKGRILDFQDDNKVVGAVVKVYLTPEDAIADKAVATSMPSDAEGNYEITVPPGSYRIIRGNRGGKAISSGNMVSTIDAFEFNIPYNDPDPVAVKTSTKDLIPGLVSVTQMDGLGVLAGSLRDCDNKEMEGGIAEVGVVPPAMYKSDGQIFYFADVPGAGTVPVRNQKWTNIDGVFAALNVPPGVGVVTAKGVTKAGGMVTTLGQYKVPVIADAVTIVQIKAGPLTAQ